MAMRAVASRICRQRSLLWSCSLSSHLSASLHSQRVTRTEWLLNGAPWDEQQQQFYAREGANSGREMATLNSTKHLDEKNALKEEKEEQRDQFTDLIHECLNAPSPLIAFKGKDRVCVLQSDRLAVVSQERLWEIQLQKARERLATAVSKRKSSDGAKVAKPVELEEDGERRIGEAVIQSETECRDLLFIRRLATGSQPSTEMFSRSFPDTRALSHHVMQKRHYKMSSVVESGRWMRITGTFEGPLRPTCTWHPFLDGGVRFKSKKKMKRAKAKKKETLSKIKRMRLITKKRKEDMNPEEKLEFRLLKGRKKMELIKQAIAKFPVQEIPPEDPDIEVLTAEQMHYLKKIGYKNKNYVPVGRRGLYGGTIQNIHMHWKKHETVQVEIAGFTKEEIQVMAVQLARLSGGVLIDIHQKNIVILYRGRNYTMPKQLIPMKTLDKRKALAKSKLEQSLKALQENDKKVEALLVALRKELAEGGGQQIKLPPPEPKLEDPDEYSEWSGAEDLDDEDDDDDDDEEDFVSDLEVSELSEPSSLLSESVDDSDEFERDSSRVFSNSVYVSDSECEGDDLDGDTVDSSALLSESDSDSECERDRLEGDKAVEK